MVRGDKLGKINLFKKDFNLNYIVLWFLVIELKRINFSLLF